jgi:hypothetical protein
MLVPVAMATFPIRETKNRRSSSSATMLLPSIPRTITWCSVPGASSLAPLGIGLCGYIDSDGFIPACCIAWLMKCKNIITLVYVVTSVPSLSVALQAYLFFCSVICQDTFDGRHNFIHIIRENLRKPYLLRVNHHMRPVAAKPHTS